MIYYIFLPIVLFLFCCGIILLVNYSAKEVGIIMLIISIIVMCGMIIYENYTNKKNKPIKIYPDIDLDIEVSV